MYVIELETKKNRKKEILFCKIKDIKWNFDSKMKLFLKEIEYWINSSWFMVDKVRRDRTLSLFFGS